VPTFSDPAPDKEETSLGDGVEPTEGDLYTAPNDVNTIDVTESADKAPWLTKAPKERKKKAWKSLKATGSPYKVALALLCLQRFWWRYGPMKRKDPAGPSAVVGKLVHGAREDAALRRIKREWPHVPKVASTAELLHLLEHQPAQLMREKEPPLVSGAVLEEAREITITSGEEDYSRVWSVEHPWTLRNLSRGFSPGGFIDQIDHEGGSPDHPERVTITDYKCSFTMPDKDELYYDPQPGLYLAWGKARWPGADVYFRLKNLRLNKVMWLRWTPAYDALHRAQARMAFQLWSSNLQTASAGDHCRYCPYREGDNHFGACSAYEGLLEKARYASSNPGGLERHPIERVMRIYLEARVGSDVSESRRLAARKVVLDKLGDQRKYTYGDLMAYTRRDRLPIFDQPWTFLHELAAVAGVEPADLFADLFSVKKGGVDKWAASIEDEETKRAVDRKIAEYRTLSEGPLILTVKRTKSMF